MGQSYAEPLNPSLGASRTGYAASLVAQVYDSAGTLQATVNTGWSELAGGSGVYGNWTLTTRRVSWGRITVVYTITGLTGFAASEVIGVDSAAAAILPNAPAGNGGLATVDANNKVGGLQSRSVSDGTVIGDATASELADVAADASAAANNTARIVTGSIYVAGDGLVAGQLTLIAGDSYTAGSGKAITIPKPAGAQWPADLNGWAIVLTGKARSDTEIGEGQSATFSTALSVSDPAGVQNLVIDALSAVTTSTLAPKPNGWTFKVVATSGVEVNTLLAGTCSIVAPT